MSMNVWNLSKVARVEVGCLTCGEVTQSDSCAAERIPSRDPRQWMRRCSARHDRDSPEGGEIFVESGDEAGRMLPCNGYDRGINESQVVRPITTKCVERVNEYIGARNEIDLTRLEQSSPHCCRDLQVASGSQDCDSFKENVFQQ